AAISQKLSDRHFGPGSDGIIYISPSDRADFKMRIFNADGSKAKMCGNGIRCVGKYVYDKGYTDKTHLSIETLSGVKTLTLFVERGKVSAATVEMGRTTVGKEMRLTVDGREYACLPVDVGNPHAVFFTEDADGVDLSRIGPMIERHAAFPGGVNAEFVQALTPASLRMRVWERGSGITMACGTGACASAAAAVSRGICPADTPLSVHLDGGTLSIVVSADGRVTMTGPAVTVMEGETELC
ncbi:MAG: diaminopimelate epimerase, partial [Clostridia bacterium]|nr:diaminopimelate epimerase [Clostridia bacterium]